MRTCPTLCGRPAARRNCRSWAGAEDVLPKKQLIIDVPSAPLPRLLPELLNRLPGLQALFGGLHEETSLEIEEALDWVTLEAGEHLFEQGDLACDAFVLTAGQLAVQVGAGSFRRTVARIEPGELVGEMALLAPGPRSATVFALHVSHLVRVPRRALDIMLEAAPAARDFLLRTLTGRLRQTSACPSLAKATIEQIAIIPLGPVEPLGETLDWLSKEVSPIAIGSDSEEDRWEYRFTSSERTRVYMAHNNSSAWTRRCIDAADRVIFVARADYPATGADAIAQAARLNREMHLVLVNKADAVAPTGACAWLDRFAADQILHIRSGDQADCQRVLRLISRSSICLVFSGGGARALAHIGAVRALEEAGVPIDAVAGTSMGALIAALVAKDLKATEIQVRMRRYLIENNPVREYTLPFVSLVRGRKLTRMFKEACEEAAIENLWKTFFCVSADLTTGAPVVHRSGPLWRALRASSAIPGVFPPVTGEGQVLVDGAIVDNMPTTTMRSLNRGTVVGVDVSSGNTISPCNVAIEQKSLLWLLTSGRRSAPSMAQVLISSGLISSGAQRASARAAADLIVEPALDDIGMLSFKNIDRAAESGYRAMQAAIPRLNELRLRQTFTDPRRAAA